MSDDTKIVVLSPASGAPEPLKAAKNKGGKGQKAEFNPLNRDIIERITIWYMTPELFRYPTTAKELARDLNISPSWVSKIKKRLPDTMPQFLNMAEEEALSNHREVVRMITAQAVAGNNKAQQLYMKHIAERKKMATQQRFQIQSETVNFGINLVLGRNNKAPAEPMTLEANEIKQLESEPENNENRLHGDIPQGISQGDRVSADIPAPQRKAANP